jgi:toxin-antitoxin system PIN domain toxin
VPDINLLLYAVGREFSQHARARRWWEQLLSGEEEVGLSAPTLFGFIRLATSRRVFRSPMSASRTVELAKEWMERPHVRFLLPGPRHLELSFGLFRALGVGGNLTTDVQLAALAMEHQAELHSSDADFARFPGLRWRNPLS